MMRIILLILSMGTILASCSTKEDKIENLISDYMFKNLHDFDSYVPIETKIDSLYSSVYSDSLINEIASLALSYKKDIDELSAEGKKIGEKMKIWENRNIFWGKDYDELFEKRWAIIFKRTDYIEQYKKCKDSIKFISNSFIPSFKGWKVIHRFRCKDRGGNYSISDYLFHFNTNLDEAIFCLDLGKEKDKATILKEIIDKAISDEEEEFFLL